jgi:type IV pilus assembly protein PilC
MASFQYNAVDAAGRTVRAQIDADSLGAAVQRLQHQGLHILEVKPNNARSHRQAPKTARPKLESLVVFSRQFAVMIDAGLPVLRCLDVLSSQTKDPALQRAQLAVIGEIEGGKPLATALHNQPQCFSELYVSMVRAAEAGGILDIILDRLATFLEKELDIRNKVKAALTYPVLVLVFATAMLNAMFIIVLPTFSSIFADLDVPLPVMTAILFGLAHVMRTYWYFHIAIPAVIILVGKKWLATPKGRLRMDGILLKLPILGDVIQKIALARFARTLGTLLSSGVPLLQTIEIVSATAGNVVLAHAITGCSRQIENGRRLVEPLQESPWFPPMLTNMVEVGEETGRLAEMLDKVADFYESEVDATVKGLTSLLEPILIMFLGVIVGGIVLCVMVPMFQLVSILGG